jgi:tetratricopeptide (TPR) repeat protein
MAADWYRNEHWNAEIARRFEERLARARQKQQYLRIQACLLAHREPEVALALLDRYFAMPPGFDAAQAHVDRAEAFTALGRIEDAVRAYEAALAREAEFPHVLTQAYVALPALVALEGLQREFARARVVLDTHVARPTFPAEHFMWHAARALIMTRCGDPVQAAAHARTALDWAAKEHSGISRHPTLGLVAARHRRLLDRVTTLVEG